MLDALSGAFVGADLTSFRFYQDQVVHFAHMQNTLPSDAHPVFYAYLEAVIFEYQHLACDCL